MQRLIMIKDDIIGAIIDGLELHGRQMKDTQLLLYLAKRPEFRECIISDLKNEMRSALNELLYEQVISAGPTSILLDNASIYPADDHTTIKLLAPRVSFQNIVTPYEMRRYLEDTYDEFRNIKYVFKYTNIHNAVRILKTKKWYISHPSKMNDQFELDQFPNWKGKYFSCFIRDQNESMAMWSMYGQPWEKGIRIAIPVQLLKEWKQSISSVYEISGKEIKDSYRIYFSNVLYFDEKNSLGKPGSKVNGFSPYNHSIMAGYVKDIAWSYEKEVRLHIDIPSYSNDGVLIDIPQYILDGVVITASPRYEGSILKELEQSGCFLPQITYSKFTEKLSWVYCDDCLKKHWNGEKQIKIYKEEQSQSKPEIDTDPECEEEESEDEETIKKRKEAFLRVLDVEDTYEAEVSANEHL